MSRRIPVDGAQPRIYDGLCSGASAEYPADSERLRIWPSVDPALGNSMRFPA
jgi:hypothetical protein